MRLDQTFHLYFVTIIVQGYALKWRKEKLANEKNSEQERAKNKAKEKTSTRQIAKSEVKQRKIKCRSYKMAKIF